MDVDEFTELRLYLSENPPLTFWEVWKMVGRICSTLYAVFAGKQRDPEKFMPQKRARPEKKPSR